MKTVEEILSQLSDLHDIWSSKFGTDDDYEKLLKLLTTWGKELCEEQKNICQEEWNKRSHLMTSGWYIHADDVLNTPLPDILKDN